MWTRRPEFGKEVNSERAKTSEEGMVRVYSAPTFVELELLEAAFRAHQLPYVVRYKLRYLEPSFAGDDLRMSHLLVHRSELAEAQALLMSLGLGNDDEASARDGFEAVLDALGTPQAQPLESLWTVDAEDFGDWLVGALPDLFERLCADAVQSALQAIEDPEQCSHRDALVRAAADAPAITRTAISDALASGPAPDPSTVWASLLAATDALRA